MDKFIQILKQLNESCTVDTTQWQNSTGKKTPNAVGAWIFTKNKDTDIDPKDEGKTYFMSKNMKYTEAKKLAIAWAKEQGYSRIYLVP